MTRERVLLGHISQASGLAGDVLIKSHTSLPEDIAAYGTLTNKDETRAFEIRVLRVTAKGVVAKIGGVDDRTAAEALRGTELYIDRDKLPAPDEDDFYHTDLIGLAAVNECGDRVGTVVAVQNFGAGDLLEIRPASSNNTEFLAFTKAVVPSVDIGTGQVTIVWPAESSNDDDKDGKSGDVARKTDDTEQKT